MCVYVIIYVLPIIRGCGSKRVCFFCSFPAHRRPFKSASHPKTFNPPFIFIFGVIAQHGRALNQIDIRRGRKFKSC